MKPFESIIRVQYYDTDKMMVVHHANYIRYFETARTEFLRSEGFAYSKMEEGDLMIPILSVQAKYKTPARYDDLLAISCRLVKMGPASMEIEYEVRDAETRELRVTGHTRHGFTNRELKPVALKKHDPEIYEFFKKLYERNQDK